MKRAKIMLSSIALVAIVSGALAFKSSHKTTATFYTRTAGNVGCTVPVILPYTTLSATFSIPYSTAFNTITTTCVAFVQNSPAE